MRPNIFWHPTIKIIDTIFNKCMWDGFVQRFLLRFTLRV